MNDYQTYIHKSRYARFLPQYGRRETWEETVARYVNYWTDKYPDVPFETYVDLEEAILNMKVMPSMRCLMTAGVALDKDNVAGYNCAYVECSYPRVFAETLYILMCGTGVGYSVEREVVERLPPVPEEIVDSGRVLEVSDSKLGWAEALNSLVRDLYSGNRPRWDLSRIRPAGSVLHTFGGRASGPGPLDSIFRAFVDTFGKAHGRKLTSLEVHDLMCRIAECVVCGGVRRSALISLSSLQDDRMRLAKTGDYFHSHPYRSLANNSVAYNGRPDAACFLREWSNLVESRNGERGIFNRDAAARVLKRSGGRRDPNHRWGCNPCSEIILRPQQFCNLTEVIARADDTIESLADKVRVATILGTLQSTLTDFRFLSKEWKDNCEEERLLGVSLTGIMDCPILNGSGDYGSMGIICLEQVLDYLKNVAITTNKEWAEKLGINPSTAITCVKPSGTVSQLCDTSSGIHPRYSEYYIRRVRGSKLEPISAFLRDAGVPCEDDKVTMEGVSTNNVFSFPMAAPTGAVCVKDVNAIQQLELWKSYALHWCEHKPSITVYVKDDEWMEVGAWVYKHFDLMSGVSFLPYDDHTYVQAPYEEITKEEYHALAAKMPDTIDWSGLREDEDHTTASQELACTGDKCEVV